MQHPNTSNLCYGFFVPFDEFNTLILSNFVARKLKTINPEMKLVTCCFRRFASLYTEFDELIFFDWPRSDSPIDVSAHDPSLRTQFALRAKEMLGERNLTEPPQLQEVNRKIELMFGKEIHKKVFGLSVEYLSKSGALLYSNSHDKLRVKNFLDCNNIGPGYQLILGRNRSVHKHHNNLLIAQIAKAISSGYEVVNATFPPPKLHKMFPIKYLEIDDAHNDYGFTIALMESANMTFVYGNASGVSIHMMTSAPLTLVGQMNWVNSRNYSYNGVTLLRARRKAGLITSHTFLGVKNTVRLKYYLRIWLDFFKFFAKKKNNRPL